MNHKLIFVTAAFCAVWPSLLYAQVTPPALPQVVPLQAAPPAQAVTLRYNFAVGQVHRYQYDMDMNMLMETGQTGAGIPMDMTMHMTLRQTVKSIRPADGAATVVSQIEEMHMLRGGQEMPLPEAQQTQMQQPFTQVMLPTGKILSMEMPALSGAEMPGMDFSKGMFSGTPFLPAGPVKVGDSWKGTTAAAMAGVQIAFTSTLDGLDQKSGTTLATIHNKQAGTIDMTMTKGTPIPIKMLGKVTGTATQLFDTTAGVLQSVTGSSATAATMTFGKAADGTTPPGMPSAMKIQTQMKFTMQRLSDTAPAAAAPVQ